MVLGKQQLVFICYVRGGIIVVLDDLHDEGDKGVDENISAGLIIAPYFE
jgi:hypothetical protein